MCCVGKRTVNTKEQLAWSHFEGRDLAKICILPSPCPTVPWLLQQSIKAMVTQPNTSLSQQDNIPCSTFISPPTPNGMSLDGHGTTPKPNESILSLVPSTTKGRCPYQWHKTARSPQLHVTRSQYLPFSKDALDSANSVHIHRDVHSPCNEKSRSAALHTSPFYRGEMKAEKLHRVRPPKDTDPVMCEELATDC